MYLNAKLYESEGMDEEAAMAYFCAAAGAAGNIFRFTGWFASSGSAMSAACRMGEGLSNLALHTAMAGRYVSAAADAIDRIKDIKSANPDAGIMDYADEWTDLWLNVAGAVFGTALSVKDVSAVWSAGKELDFAVQEIKAVRAASGKIHYGWKEFWADNRGCVDSDALFGRKGDTYQGSSVSKKPIQAYEVTSYEDFQLRSVVGDGLEGHEMWQHANLNQNGYATK